MTCHENCVEQSDGCVGRFDAMAVIDDVEYDVVDAGKVVFGDVYYQRCFCGTVAIGVYVAYKIVTEDFGYKNKAVDIDAFTTEKVIKRLSLAIDEAGKFFV